MYEFVFSHSSIVGPFGLYSSYPRSLIELCKVVDGSEGILTVEEGEGLINPLSLGDMVRYLPVPVFSLSALSLTRVYFT